MNRILTVIAVIVVTAVSGMWHSVAQQSARSDGPRFTSSNALIRPADYRKWIYLTSGLGMTYGAAAAANRPPMFDNVFVNPSSHEYFLQNGKWPDRTIFILEIRSAESNVSINKGGHSQGSLVAVEAAVKDSRFAGNWAYFDLSTSAATADALPASRGCFACHNANGAVENTFVQFYPTLFEVAKQKGTVREYSEHDVSGDAHRR